MPAMTADQVQATIDAIDLKLNAGFRRVDEVGRSVLIDLDALKSRRAELVTLLNTLQPLSTPMPRRLLTFSTKGL